MEQLLHGLAWLFALNTAAATAFLFTLLLIGRHWVKRRTPLWLTGVGLYSHQLLDGLEYVLTRSALGVSMARSFLVFKLMHRSMVTAQKNMTASAAGTATPPSLPTPPPLKPAASPSPSPSLEKELNTVPLESSSLASASASASAPRKRARIQPPGIPTPKL